MKYKAKLVKGETYHILNLNFRNDGKEHVIDENLAQYLSNNPQFVVSEVEEAQSVDRDELKEKARELGIEFKENISTKSLLKLIEEAEKEGEKYEEGGE